MLEIKESKIPAFLIPQKPVVEKNKKIIDISQKILGFILKSLLSLIIICVLITAVILVYLYIIFDQFTQTAEVSKTELINLVKQSWNTAPQTTNDYKNILILGVDSLETRGNVPPLADTLILASINTKSGQIRLLSLPRDIWSEAYKTKINALIAYGQDRDPAHPENFSQEVIAQLTNLPIHHTVVLSIDDLAELIDLLGGIEVDIKQGFVDNEFPRSDVDITAETNPAKLYETVKFEPGIELMSGERALKYIRSRHSEDLSAGTDLSRSNRQQEVLQAIFTKLKDWQQLAQNPKQLGLIYKYYQQNFGQYLSTGELISTGHSLYPHLQGISLTGNALSIYPEDEAGVIYHPPVWNYQGQWVYEIRDLSKFQNEVKTKVNP